MIVNNNYSMRTFSIKITKRTFGLREPGFYKVKADNSRIDVEIAEIKSDIAYKKIRLAQLNEAKSKATNKDLFIDQMAAVREDINRLQNNIEKLKGRYKEYKEI